MSDNYSGGGRQDSLSSDRADLQLTPENDANKVDDEEREEEAESLGFPVPIQNEDHFKMARPSKDLKEKKADNDTNALSSPSNTHGAKIRTNSVETRTTKSVVGRTKSKTKSKVFKYLKPPRTRSNDSVELLDPEEEKLKMLPDCCEFVKKTEGYEADDSRKEMTTAWFTRIKLKDTQQKQLCFSESLLMVEENGAVVGKMYCSVTQSKWCDKPCICVHAGSCAKFPTGLESGTTITSFVNNKLKPLQELVHEWATLGPNTLERKTFLINEGEHTPCKITMIKNGRTIDTKSVSLGFTEMESLVTEATNILLHRLLIQEKRTNGNINLLCLSYIGKAVKARYGELGSGWENVKGKQIKTWGIRRTVFASEDEERQLDSLFNKHSRLILKCQPDSPQALIPLWFESIIDFDKHGNFTGLYSPYAWACDVELYSKYAIKKEEVTHDHRRYIMDHPEVRALLSDYLQAVLFRKPQDIISFTKTYFQAFLTLRGRTTKPSTHKAASQLSSSSYYGSSMSLTGEYGEWFGEGEDDDRDFYPINPTVDYDGLEKVDDDGVVNFSEGEPGIYTENETEDDLIVNEEGKYVRN